MFGLIAFSLVLTLPPQGPLPPQAPPLLAAAEPTKPPVELPSHPLEPYADLTAQVDLLDDRLGRIEDAVAALTKLRKGHEGVVGAVDHLAARLETAEKRIRYVTRRVARTGGPPSHDEEADVEWLQPPEKPKPKPAPASPAVLAPADRRPRGWYRLSNLPGWEGYGTLNARGQVEVEHHRYVGVPVAPVPVPSPVYRSMPAMPTLRPMSMMPALRPMFRSAPAYCSGGT